MQQKLLLRPRLGKNMLLTSLHFVANRLSQLPRPHPWASLANYLGKSCEPQNQQRPFVVAQNKCCAPVFAANVNVATKGTQLGKCVVSREDKCLKIYNNK